MPIVYHYKLTAAEGKRGALVTALLGLAAHLRSVPQCIAVQLLQEIDNPEAFLLTEQWASVDSYENSKAQLPRDAFEAVKANLANRPQRVGLIPF